MTDRQWALQLSRRQGDMVRNMAGHLGLNEQQVEEMRATRGDTPVLWLLEDVLTKWFHNERKHEHYKRQAEKLTAEIDRASAAIAEHYPTLRGDQWREQGMALSALVECMTAELKATKGDGK
jgi:hypothetical protein